MMNDPKPLKGLKTLIMKFLWGGYTELKAFLP